MNTLARHNRQPGSHDHLPFHPGCPACRRARTSRSIAEVPVLTARVRAGITAAVLGASTIAATLRTAGPAAAQTKTQSTTDPSDAAPRPATPGELDQNLADPNKPDRKSPQPSVHVVKPGDNLWTVARQELGGKERPTNARVAREVDRLWSINAASVGTGDRDLIYPGQRLKLR